MTALAARPLGPTANDRLKQGFEARLALSFIVAAVLHFLVFELWPSMQVPTWAVPTDGGTTVIDIPTVDIPDAPPRIARPATPVVTTDVAPTATIPEVGWSEVAEIPPPPPTTNPEGATSGPTFTPYTIAPALLNPAEVERALEREYPAILRDAGITGAVALLVHIDATGSVLETRVGASSGVAGLDEAALRVAEVFRFRAAQNRDTPVAVWVRLPVTFRIR